MRCNFKRKKIQHKSTKMNIAKVLDRVDPDEVAHNQPPHLYPALCTLSIANIPIYEWRPVTRVL